MLGLAIREADITSFIVGEDETERRKYTLSHSKERHAVPIEWPKYY